MKALPKRGVAVALLVACLPAVSWAQTSAPAGGPGRSFRWPVPRAANHRRRGAPASAPDRSCRPRRHPGFRRQSHGQPRLCAAPITGVNYYELGQLGKGDLVSVVGQKLGWYQILPPEGTYFYIAKEYVEADPSGATGKTAKAAFVNVRAASALHPNSDYAILGSIRRGTDLTLLGTQTIPGTPAKEYYKVAPPAGIAVYVKPDLVVTAPSGTEYKTPALQLPASVATPAGWPLQERPPLPGRRCGRHHGGPHPRHADADSACHHCASCRHRAG